MIYKVLKPSGKDDVEKWENLTNKKRSKGLSNDKKSRGKLNIVSPASLEAFNYFGKDIDDPQVKLKLLEITHKNPPEETSAGVLEFVKHMTSVIGDKKCPVLYNNCQGNERYSVRNKEKCKINSFEKVTQTSDECKNSLERTKTQKINFSKKQRVLKSKSYISESTESKSVIKIVSKSPGRRTESKIPSRSPDRRTENKIISNNPDRTESKILSRGPDKRTESKILSRSPDRRTESKIISNSPDRTESKILSRGPDRRTESKILSRSPDRRTESKILSRSAERRFDNKIVSNSPEKKKNYDLRERLPNRKNSESPQGHCRENPKKEIPMNESAAEPVNKKRLRRSEIPLLKSRQISEKRTEVVSLLMQKPLQENDSSTSINFYQDFKRPPNDELCVASELEIILKAGYSSPKLDNIGEVHLRESPRQTPETLDCCLKSTNVPVASKIPNTTEADKKTVKASKPKTLDLEKVKTSSFTVLRTESDSFSRLESFHKQNLTAKETARAEIAIRASKIMVMTSKTSFTSIKSKKNYSPPSSSKGSKMNSKKAKKTKDEQQESNSQKKVSDTPHLDICKEIIATGKVGCLIPKKITEDYENLGVDDKCPPSAAVECQDKKVSKRTPRGRLESKKGGMKIPRKKMQQSSEEILPINSPPVNNELNGSLSESSIGRPSETAVIESKVSDLSQEDILKEVPNEEVKLMAREVAGLVVTGTALNFDDMEVLDKPSEVDRIKLEIKINVPSEEDVSDNEALECDSSGEIGRASLDWLLKSKLQNNEKQVHEILKENEKTMKDDFISWDWFAEELKPGEWQANEPVLQGTHRSLSSIKNTADFKTKVVSTDALKEKTQSKPGDRRPVFEDPFNCSMFFQKENKPDTKVRSGFTRASNREEKIFEDPIPLKLRRRNSEPYSLRGFIWKRADVTSPKNLKNSVSSVASSLKHLNTDEMDDFIFWEAVPQKMTSCWEMSLYHFKRPWSVLSCSVFKDNRRSNTPGLILDTLRSGGVTNMRRPLIYQNDRINRHKGNIFDVEPSISQKNIDIRNWLAALNFTTPISNNSDVISEGNFSTSPVMDTQNQTNLKHRNVIPHLKLPDKIPEKKIFRKEKHRKLDKWNISDMNGLKELIRRKSGSYVTKEQYILSELSSPKSTGITNASTYSTPPEDLVLREKGDQSTMKDAKVVKSVETSCQSELPEEADIAQEQLEFKEASDSPSASLVGSFKREMIDLSPEINIWKYLFLFTLMFIIFQHSLGSDFAISS